MKDKAPTIKAKGYPTFIAVRKIRISPAKLGVGGAAMLAIENKNHHKVRVGEIAIPLCIK